MRYQSYVNISEIIAQQLNEYLESFCNKNPVFKDLLNDYSKKRIHLNGIQFYAGLNATKGNIKFEEILDIPIAIECIMLMAYKTNRILDHKQEVWDSEEKIKQTMLDEIMFLTLILKLLENSRKKLGWKYNQVRDIFLDMIANINEGFRYEKYFLNSKFSSLENITKNWSLKYQKRNILFNSIYDYAPLIWYYISSNDKTIFSKYKNNVKDEDKFSHAGQIINDLSDFSSIFDENVKSYQDAFSDIRNGVITLPTFLLIKEQSILNALDDAKLTKNIDWRKEVMQLITKNNILGKIKKLTKQSYIANIDFWKNIMKIDNELLFSTYLLLLKNKYFNEFKKQNKIN